MNEVVPQTIPIKDSQPVDTSGTVGGTVIDVITLIEHAARRCGVQPTQMTPENLEMGKNNLFFLLSELSNRGINLWTVEQLYIPIVENKVRYAMPNTTEAVLRMAYRTMSSFVGSPLSDPQTYGYTFPEPRRVTTIGFKLAADISTYLAVEATYDGINWVVVYNFGSINLSQGWQWYTLDAAVTAKGVRVRDTTDAVLPVFQMVLGDTVNDLPMERMNRDEYIDLNNKQAPGTPVNFYFEKKIESAVYFWPMPVDEIGFFIMWRQRAIQDVGSLSNKLEIPDRWYDAIIWKLAKNLSFELPNVNDERIAAIMAQAADSESRAELGESDGANLSIRPNIGMYTR